MRSTGNCSAEIERLGAALEQADTVLIGAGAGLSASAGFTYDGERFQRYFSDFEEKYGFHDMYSGGFYPYKTPEERWAYWSRFVCVNRYIGSMAFCNIGSNPILQVNIFCRLQREQIGVHTFISLISFRVSITTIVHIAAYIGGITIGFALHVIP